MARGKYTSLPEQRFLIRGMRIKGLSSWQKMYQMARARGVWEILGYVNARSPWEACGEFRKVLPNFGLYHTLQAIPTFAEPHPEGEKVRRIVYKKRVVRGQRQHIPLVVT